ncbi:conserved protein of unknown function [Ectopseudomonas oleovorans]|uniref:Uncharacterized protein n=1 Tax=Ectopseudomonas oleovorans TaxID=301 RepID=A0A653B4R4_ECTOL|nr:conserved protein of unknown function [Pseudomonas oleovorans]
MCWLFTRLPCRVFFATGAARATTLPVALNDDARLALPGLRVPYRLGERLRDKQPCALPVP